MIPFTIESKSVRLRNKFHERRIGLIHTKNTQNDKSVGKKLKRT